ncbi:sialidase family protein [Klebsiella pneumoniae]|uniref:sialidase family protein n=1 Tax=Klebsiella pneumoniae TaxID=573 RepID=UPI001F302C14|nr:sialidase family protein [Klebsiella pneumoniae]
MADFDPALGSSSPAVLLDNATRLDKLVNGTEEEVSDRGGEPLPTWRNMVVKIDAQVSQLESIIGGLDGDLPILDSVESGLAATSEGQYFRVPGGAEETTSFYIYKNVSGVADLVARQLGYAEINEIKELVFYKTSPLISYNEDYSGNRFAAYSPDGGFFLPGMIGALQDQYAIKNAGKIKVGMAKAETISEVVGTDETIFLSRQNDDTGSGYVVFSPDGGMYLLGMIGALQDQYAIKNAADIKAGIAGINAVQASVEAMRPTLIDRLFYAQNKAGELVSQAVRIGRVTRRQKTGYNLNSWPQGKLCIDSNGRIYCGYNSAPSHGGAGTVPVLTCSDDDGVSWSDPVQIVTGENYVRGTDWWSLGVDSDNHLWGIVRSRGATNLVGVTFYNLYKSTDGGASWVKVGEISSVTQTISDVEYVPELFHDMCYIPTTGRMVTGYHFANSSRVGFMSFDISDPLNTIITQDVIAHGEFSTTVYCEPTIAVEYTRNAEGTIYGGLRTQTTGNPSQLYFMNTDLTGFTRFNAPESVQYSPMTIRRINGQFILLTVERYNTGAMNLWFGTPADFYSMAASNFWKMPIGKIVDETTTGASNVGVQDMEIYGDHLYFAWSNETQNTYADTYIGKMNIVNPASLLNNDYLEGL